EGPAEWLAEPRQRADALAGDAAFNLARILLGNDDAGGAIAAAEFGLRVDPYRDELWRIVIDAHQVNGDVLAAGRAREQYATRLRELGVADFVSSSSGTRSR